MTIKAFRWSVGASVLLTVLLHLRFFFTPLTSDEGGYLAIARAWGHGRDLYRQVWIDRPQGLLVLFRAWDDVAGGSTASVRILATVFAAVAVVAGAFIADALGSPRAGALAAAFVAIISSTPVLEGFIANGELLSGALSTAGLAVGCIVLAGRCNLRWMYVAGLLAGCAMSIKQSGFDGFVAIFAWLILALGLAWRERRYVLHALCLVVGGLATVMAVLAAHGALTGWHDWWFAVAGYRLDSRSALVGADWGRLLTTARVAAPILSPLLIGSIACGVALYVTPARRPRPEHSMLLIWLLAASAAFLSGGQFHRHYWITLTFPLAVIAAMLIASVRVFWIRSALAWAVIVPALVSAIVIIGLPRDQVPVRASNDPRLIIDEHMADWYRANHAPGETMYILCASAAFYGNALEDPPYPYLWLDGVRQVPGAREALGTMLSTAAQRPTFVALYQSTSGCDPSGVSGRAFDQYYRPLAIVDGVQIVVRTDR
jgi:hypothetical protein